MSYKRPLERSVRLVELCNHNSHSIHFFEIPQIEVKSESRQSGLLQFRDSAISTHPLHRIDRISLPILQSSTICLPAQPSRIVTIL